jgi:hypothetical protein
MKKMLCLVLFFCVVDISFAMKPKELMYIDIVEGRELSKLVAGNFDNAKAQTCIDSIRNLIAKIEESGDRSGAAILTLDNLYSIIDIIEMLINYKHTQLRKDKDTLFSISNSYGGQVSELIHSVVDER